jgi:hypothetical protein
MVPSTVPSIKVASRNAAFLDFEGRALTIFSHSCRGRATLELRVNIIELLVALRVRSQKWDRFVISQINLKMLLHLMLHRAFGRFNGL